MNDSDESPSTGPVARQEAPPQEALPDEEPDHDCQVPRDDPPELGGEWQCPECGTWWRLESAKEHPEHLPARREQRINWVREGKSEGSRSPDR